MLITLSQNEIAARAAKFAVDWKEAEREEAEAPRAMFQTRQSGRSCLHGIDKKL